MQRLVSAEECNTNHLLFIVALAAVFDMLALGLGVQRRPSCGHLPRGVAKWEVVRGDKHDHNQSLARNQDLKSVCDFNSDKI